MGFIIFDLLTAPVLGPIKGVYWLAEQVKGAVDQDLLDEDKVRGELLRLQWSYEVGEVAEEDYIHQEAALLERLNAIREAKGEKAP